ncbi:ATP-binding protein [Alicyclobacillus sp. SO9]|uniref:ATP-binding protein n=1 Tax=Alicyclobacillus sp. SO9 TaxID=2665646 RepID=UPI0018E8C826|nr:ATP-binding protein [Alicyclobacillus sp. SO9]QQE79668.1 ATP-binding protein [Alicyclobacillus sp. SO9]
MAHKLFPAMYWEDNRIFDVEGQAWGVYKLPQFPYEFRAETERLAVSDRFERFLHNYTGKGMLLSLSKQLSRQQLEQQMRARSSHPVWQEHVDAAMTELKYRLAYERRVYLILPLRTSTANLRLDQLLTDSNAWKETLKKAGRQVMNGIMDVGQSALDAFLRQGTQKELSEELLQAAYSVDRQLMAKLNGAMSGKVERATPAELEWLHRKPYFRGIEEPQSVLPEQLPVLVSTKQNTTVIRPLRTSMLQIAEADVVEDLFRIRVQHPNQQTSYQSVMALSNFAEGIEDLGNEWLYEPLEKLDFPVDACIHFEVIPGHVARAKVHRKKGAAEDQWDELAKDGDVELDVEDGLADAPISAKLKEGMPLVEFQSFMAIGADNEHKLLEREEQLINQMDGYARLVHPQGDARALLQAFFPCFTGGVHSTWKVPAEPRVVACAAPLGTSTLGDPSGFLFGHLIHSGKPVFMDPERPMRVLNHSGSMALIGVTGSGKSMTMKNITDKLLALSGIGYVLDPKKDEYFSLYQRWEKDAYWLRYGREAEAAFTPFHLATDARDARAIAQGWLGILLNISGSREDRYAAIVVNAALNKLYQTQSWDMESFLACVARVGEEGENEKERQTAALIRRILDQFRHDPVAQCVFGQDEANHTLAEAKLVVQSLRNLEFPDRSMPDPDKWREPQRFAVSMLYLSTQIGLRKLMEADSVIPKFFLIDEAWILRSIPEGRELINRILLLGRALNLILVLGIQNPDVLLPKHENDDLTANLGWLMFFTLESNVQVRHAVQILHLPDDEDWQKVFSEFGNGHGLVRNPEGHVGELQVDLLPETLKEAFSTTPGGTETEGKTRQRKVRLQRA